MAEERTLSPGTVDPYLVPTEIFDTVYQPYQNINPSFWDTVQAHFGYYYDTQYEALKEDLYHGDAKMLPLASGGGMGVPNLNTYFAMEDAREQNIGMRVGQDIDPDFNPFDPEFLEGYEEHAMYFADTRNAEHFAFKKRVLDENIKRREIIQESGVFQNLGAAFFDPINFIALPFGGPTFGIARSATRVAAGTGVIVAAQEATRYPFDPLATPAEVGLNVGFATLFGGVLGGAFGAPITISARKAIQAQKTFREGIQKNNEAVDFATAAYKNAEVMQNLPRRSNPDISLPFTSYDIDITRTQLKEAQELFNINESRLKIIKAGKGGKATTDLYKTFGGGDKQLAIEAITKIKDQAKLRIDELEKVIKSRIFKDSEAVIDGKKKTMKVGDEVIDLTKLKTLGTQDQIIHNDKQIRAAGKKQRKVIDEQMTNLRQLQVEYNAYRASMLKKKIYGQRRNRAFDPDNELHQGQFAKIMNESAPQKKMIEANNRLQAAKNRIEQLKLDYKDNLKTASERRKAIDENAADLAYTESWFVNSPLYKFIPSPLKNVLNSNAPGIAKYYMLKLIHDKGVQLKLIEKGLHLGNSTHAAKALHKGKIYEFQQQMRAYYLVSIGSAPREATNLFSMEQLNVPNILLKARRSVGMGQNIMTEEEFGSKMIMRYILNEAGDNDVEDQAIAYLKKIWKKEEREKLEAGLIGNEEYLRGKLPNIRMEITRNKEKLDKYSKEVTDLEHLRDAYKFDYSGRRQEINDELEKLSSLNLRKKNEETGMPYTDAEKKTIRTKIKQHKQRIANKGLIDFEEERLGQLQQWVESYQNRIQQLHTEREATLHRLAELQDVAVSPKSYTSTLNINNIGELSEKEMVKLFGKEFNVQKVILDDYKNLFVYMKMIQKDLPKKERTLDGLTLEDFKNNISVLGLHYYGMRTIINDKQITRVSTSKYAKVFGKLVPNKGVLFLDRNAIARDFDDMARITDPAAREKYLRDQLERKFADYLDLVIRAEERFKGVSTDYNRTINDIKVRFQRFFDSLPNRIWSSEDFDAMRKAFKESLELPQYGMTTQLPPQMRKLAMKNIDEMIEDTAIMWNHKKHAYDNFDKFKTKGDYEDFIIFHEMYHGKRRPKRGETEVDLENVINELALKRSLAEGEKFAQASRVIENYFPRYYDHRAIRNNRKRFEDILTNYYFKNPYHVTWNSRTNQMDVIPRSPTRKEARNRAKETTQRILNENYEEVEDIYTGQGKAKHFKHRELDIPNSLILDFIELDPLKVHKAYVERTSGMVEFKRTFGTNATIDSLKDDIFDSVADAGGTVERAQEIFKEIRFAYDRVVVGRTTDNPHSWDKSVSYAVRTGAQLKYLGGAFFATLAEPAIIMMNHGIGRTMFTLYEAVTDAKVKASVKDIGAYGEAIDLALGSAQHKFVDDINMSPFGDSFWDKTKNAFYVLNGLTWATQTMKRLDALARAHHYIDSAVKWSRDGNLPEQDKLYLLRYDIDKSASDKIRALVDDGTIEKSTNGLYLANTNMWDDIELRDNFRTSLSSGMLNTIIMGTPADKPKLVDGVILLKKRTVDKSGLGGVFPEHPDYPGYVKIENQLLALPFQFYSYSLGAVNKVTASMTQGALKNRSTAVLMGIGLAYMSVWLRTPDYAWDKMEPQDKLMRALEYSGVAAIYMDLFYESFHSMLALNGVNITGGFLNPKYKDEPYESLIGLTGAGPSYVTDVVQGIYEMMAGDFGLGVAKTMKNLPFTGVPYFRGQVNDLAATIDNNLD